MEKILKESYTYKLIIMIGNYIKKLFSESFLIGLFTKETNGEREKDFFLVKWLNAVINLFRKIAFKLHLDKLFDNSIFAKPIIWLSLTVFLTPFIPTMLALGLLIITSLSLFLKILITPDFQFRFCRPNLWVMLFLGVILVAGFTSVSLAESKKIALLLFAFVFSYFVMINTVENTKQFTFLLYAFVIAGTIASVYGIYQYVFGDIYSQAWLDSEMFEDIRMRVYSTFENPNVFGEYLILVIPVIMALFWTQKGFIKKTVLLGMLGVTMLAAVLTFSRGCWLGIILEVGILLLIIDKRFIFLGIAGIFLLPFVLPDTIINRFLSIGNMGDSSTSYRVYIWLGTIAMLKDYWFSGVGLGKTSFNAVYPVYSYGAIAAPHSHNLFLQLMTEYGIVGLGLFIIIMYQFYKSATIKLIKQKDILLASIVAGMTGFLLESLFDYTWYNYRVVLIFWMVLSLGVLKSHMKEEIIDEKKM